QGATLYFLGLGARDDADRLRVARQHEGGHAASQEPAHLFRPEPRPGDDDRLDLLSEDRIGDADHGGVLYLGMVQQGRLDLERRDVLAAASDDLLHPAAEIEIAVLVHAARIPGMEPEIACRFP